MKQKVLVLFSIITSLLSMVVGFMQKFLHSLNVIDMRIIFFSGIFLFVVILLLLYFLFHEVINKFYDDKKDKEKEKEIKKKRAKARKYRENAKKKSKKKK